MALRKKGSRIILIDDERYRWLVSPNDGYHVFVAEKEDVEGCKVEVYFETEVNKYWVNFPNAGNLNLKILTPKDAETIIRKALMQGWNPKKKGSPIVFDFAANELTKRKDSVPSIKG